MLSLLKNKLAVLLSLALVGLLTLNCKETSSDVGGVFTFLKGDVKLNSTVAKLGEVVKKGDVITSQKKSAAVIQFLDGALITIKASSEIAISELSVSKESQEVVLTQKKGSTFSKIISTEEVQYSINSPTLTAGVRGTSFEFNVSKEGETEVKLLKGKVAVKSASSSSEKEDALLEQGQKLKATKAYGVSEPQRLNKREIRELQTLDKVQIVPEVEKKINQAESDFVDVIPEASIETISGEQRKYTLSDLKLEYGRISKIITKDGKVYVGNFLQKGSKSPMIVRTLDGQFTIPANKIKKVSPF